MSTPTGQVSTVAFGLVASTVAGAVAEAVGLPGLPVSLVVAVGISAIEATGISRSQPTPLDAPVDPTIPDSEPVVVTLTQADLVVDRLDPEPAWATPPLPVPVSAKPAAKRKRSQPSSSRVTPTPKTL